jgi:hypothetical protein
LRIPPQCYRMFYLRFLYGRQWVQSLKEIVPNIKRIGVVFNPQTAPYMQSIVHSVESAAGPLHVKFWQFRCSMMLSSIRL